VSSQSGTLPYMATVFPLEGVVPSGQSLVSAQDASLRGSVLSTWPDGSAAVMVVAGETSLSANTTKSLSLSVTSTAGTPLTAARIAQLVNSISCNFGSHGSAALSNFSAPERVWWANPSVICARYRAPIGSGGLEAVIDIHAFATSSRAFVEVVIENGRIDANAASPAAPSNKTYSGATVVVNGSTIATVSSASGGAPRSRMGAGYSGGHEAFRAWYTSTWVGGDPAVEVTHDAASLQAHPWFWRYLEPTNKNLQSFYSQSYDTYVPWALCRIRAPGMASGGDDEQIAMFTEEQCDYIHSGDRYARRAVIATGLAFHSLNFNWRHSGSGAYNGQVPARSQLTGKSSADGGQGNWPRISTEPRYGGGSFDGSHIPATTLIPFLCQPSPCFIELAQKEFAWNHTNYGSTTGWHEYDQVRSRAWRSRNYAIATWLTPDADAARKAEYRAVLGINATNLQRFFGKSWNTLGVMWQYGPDNIEDGRWPDGTNILEPSFQHWFCAMSWNAIALTKVARGADGTAWNSLADQIARLPVRIVNEAVGGEWRKQGITLYVGTLGANRSALTQPASHSAQQLFGVQGTPPAQSSGTWLNGYPDAGGTNNWQTMPEDNIPFGYSAQFFSALSIAVERGVTGAEQAWAKVVTNGGISNFGLWRTRLRSTQRFNRYPRNK
jgi:hypothetical protein